MASAASATFALKSTRLIKPVQPAHRYREVIVTASPSRAQSLGGARSMSDFHSSRVDSAVAHVIESGNATHRGAREPRCLRFPFPAGIAGRAWGKTATSWVSKTDPAGGP